MPPFQVLVTDTNHLVLLIWHENIQRELFFLKLELKKKILTARSYCGFSKI